jgi:non-heme chloroperoxidase
MHGRTKIFNKLTFEIPKRKETLMTNRELIDIGSGVNLHIRDWGEGIPIVFIHGWPLSHEMWEYQFTHLAPKGHRCVGITLRGFGKSSQPWGEYNYDIFADDIKRVLGALKLRDVTLVGFSMGGAISLHYLARHKAERVSKLVLAGAAAPSWTKRPDFPYGLEKSAVDAFIGACHSDRAQLMADFSKDFFRNETAVTPRFADWFFNMNMGASPYATASCLVVLRDADLRSDLSRVNVPTVIFHGAQDKIVPFALGEQAANGIKGAQLIRFESSGHGLFYEEKEKFNEELTDFVAGRRAAAVGGTR